MCIYIYTHIQVNMGRGMAITGKLHQHIRVSLLIATHTCCIISPAEHQKSQPLLHTCICQERSAANQQKHEEHLQKINKIHRALPSSGLGGRFAPPNLWILNFLLTFLVFLLIPCRSFLAYTCV